MLPKPIENFIKIFAALPGIGVRQATRLAFKLISGGKAKIEEMAIAVSDLGHMKTCSRCFFIHQNKDDICDICRNPERKESIIAVVEKETDLISIEKTKKFKGRYLVLGELAKTGVLESGHKLRLNHFKNLIKKENSPQGQVDEIIIALNPTTYGDLNALMLAKELKDSAKKITRLGRGIPTGGEIEFADEDTLQNALERRN
ncbi:recombination protein RecR [Candidatus Wolfebacteria bacterium]|nr:recombination protein RecR [Candidatus Wolfebacteria bacterium]